MLLNPLTGVLSGASSRLQESASRSVARIVSGERLQRAADDVAGLAIAKQLQAQAAVLRSAGTNISQALSLTQVADGAIQQQIDITERQIQLATQANNGALSADERKQLDAEFQALTEERGRIAAGTRFNGAPLLDGTYTLDVNQTLGGGDAGGEENVAITIPDLSPSALPGGDSLSLLTQEGAAEAFAALSAQRDSLTAVRAEVGSFSQSLEFASAAVDSARANIDAANSTLSDADFIEEATNLAQVTVQRDINLALQAQTNKLPANVLDLLNSQAS